MKPFAVIASRFQKTILVDADVIFLQKPEIIFDVHAGMETTGSSFHHDREYKMEGKSRAAWVRTYLMEGLQAKTSRTAYSGRKTYGKKWNLVSWRLTKVIPEYL